MSCTWRMFTFANDADHCVFQPPGQQQKVTRVKYCPRVRLLIDKWPDPAPGHNSKVGYFCWLSLLHHICFFFLLVGCELRIHNPLEGEVAQKYVYIKSISSPNPSDKVLIKFHMTFFCERTYADQVLYLQPHCHTHFVLHLKQVFLENERKYWQIEQDI